MSYTVLGVAFAIDGHALVAAAGRQAHTQGLPVMRPMVAETTSLGAAYAAGLATGFWGTVDDLRDVRYCEIIPVTREGRSYHVNRPFIAKPIITYTC